MNEGEKMVTRKELRRSAGSRSMSKPVKRKSEGVSPMTPGEASEKLGNLDQVRDIIFGPQLREFNRRFEKIESDLSSFQEEMRHRVDEARSVFSGELRAAVESLAKKIRTLSSVVQEEWTDLRQQLERVDKKFTNSLETLSSEVDADTTSLREELMQTRDRLQEDVRNLKAQIHEELDRRFSMLGDIKISREELAEILFEVGMRLKGAEFVPDLRDSPIV